MLKSGWHWIEKGNYRSLFKIIGSRHAPTDAASASGIVAWYIVSPSIEIYSNRIFLNPKDKFNYTIEENAIPASEMNSDKKHDLIKLCLNKVNRVIK